MVTIKCNKPKTCGKCTFVVYYENLHRGIPDCCCGLQYLLNRQDREVDPKNMDSQCPLKEVDELLFNSQLVGHKDPIGPRGNRGGCRKTHSFSEFLGNAIEIMTSVFKYGDPSYKYEDMKTAFDDLLHEYERLIAVTRPTQGRQPEERQANINGISVNFVLMPPPIKDPMGPRGPKGVLRTPRSFNEFLGGAVEDIVGTYKHGDLDCRYIDMEATLADLLCEYETLIKGDKQ